MSDISLTTYRSLTSNEKRAAFRCAMEAKGYSAFFAFVEDFRAMLKSYDESDQQAIGQLLQHSRADFPDPQRFSPSWAGIWNEFDNLYAEKNGVMRDIPVQERDGEWQVLIDNPYLPHHVVCYPALAFADAAYSYAYFQKDLKPNELLRLQKVSHVLVTSGRKEASMLPDT